MLPPASGSKNEPSNKPGKLCLVFVASLFLLDLLLIPEDGIDIPLKLWLTQRNTRRFIPDDKTLHNHGYENLMSYIMMALNHNTLLLFRKITV
jgi:hypothetical protein